MIKLAPLLVIRLAALRTILRKTHQLLSVECSAHSLVIRTVQTSSRCTLCLK